MKNNLGYVEQKLHEDKLYGFETLTDQLFSKKSSDGGITWDCQSVPVFENTQATHRFFVEYGLILVEFGRCALSAQFGWTDEEIARA